MEDVLPYSLLQGVEDQVLTVNAYIHSIYISLLARQLGTFI